jgi:spore coat protein CotH
MRCNRSYLAAPALWGVLLPLVLSAAGARVENELFADGAVWRIRLEVASEDLKSLRNGPREYVHATLREGTNVLRDVALRLKGSNSFRTVDDKPSFTINCDRFSADQRFHGLSKIHLNNSVEDPSYLNEKLGAELFYAAGLPVPRVAHALVELNGRRLGLYVLKEGFAREFLARHFQRTDGNLYEPQAGVAPDVTGAMLRNSGDGPGDHTDLRRLAEASASDPALRWKALGEVLDTDRFLTFMAMEILSGHRDGYCLARNNYRVYCDPTSNRSVFLADGMDQLFGRADFPVEPHMAGVVAKAVLETQEGRREYRKRLALLFTNCFKVEALTNRLQTWTDAIASNLTRAEARTLRREVDDLCERIRQRVLYVRHQLAESTSKPTDER